MGKLSPEIRWWPLEDIMRRRGQGSPRIQEGLERWLGCFECRKEGLWKRLARTDRQTLGRAEVRGKGP